MNFQIITLLPDLFPCALKEGVVGQALKSGLISMNLVNPRQFVSDNHKTVDDRPFGGGDGMLMLAEPLQLALQSLPEKGHVVYLSPQGPRLTDRKVQELVKHPNLTLICGRYGGIDQRFLNQEVDEEISIGDYVLSGGEYAALVIIDAVSRFIPGVLGHKDSVFLDSITSGGLEAPSFTRPREWQGTPVPEILSSGHHEKIQEWRRCMGVMITFLKRPDLYVPPELQARQKRQWMDWLRESQNYSALGVLEKDVSLFLKEVEEC